MPDFQVVRSAEYRRSLYWAVAVIVVAILVISSLWLLSEAIPSMLFSEPVISELMAANTFTLLDDDQDAADWLEIANPSGKTINLDGYGLIAEPTSDPWHFPPTELGPGERLLVWASGKDRVIQEQRLVVKGGGRDIWNRRDSFSFFYITTDEPRFTLTAQVPYFQDTDPWAKAGIMIRSDLDPASPHAAIFVTPSSGYAMQFRSTWGNHSQHRDAPIGLETPNAWVRIERNGPLIRGYVSSNGTEWHELAELNLRPLDSRVYVGLAVTSHQEGQLAEAHFTNIQSTPSLALSAQGKFVDIGTKDRGNSAQAEIRIFHTNFRLPAAGGFLGLTNPDGQLIDAVEYPGQTRDVSYGRNLPHNGWVFFSTATPGEPHSDPGGTAVSEPPRFDANSGAYQQPIQVEITAPNLSRVYYTLDGSLPDRNSAIYSRPLTFNKSTVLRARTFEAGKIFGPVRSAVYLIGETLPLPVLSIVTEPQNLFDQETGIYTNPHRQGRAWERPAAVTLIEKDGTTAFHYDHLIGLRIHGGASRGIEKKSLRLYWRGDASLEYPLFPNKPEIDWFKRLIVRSGGNDHALGHDGRYTWTLMRCAVQGELFRQAGGLASAHYPVHVLLNGESLGVYNLRERIDKYFLQENANLDPSNLDLLKVEHPGRVLVKEGSREHWDQTLAFFAGNSLSNAEEYQKAAELIDIANFTDWYLMQIYAGNWDWPQNNIYMYRPADGSAPWRFILWDVDDAFDLRSPTRHNTLEWAARDRARRDLSPPWYAEAGGDTLHTTLIFRRLLENEDYRRFLATRWEELAKTVLAPQHVQAEIERAAAMLAPGIHLETSRWGTSPLQWESNVERMKEYAAVRPGIVSDQLQRLLAKYR